MPHGVEVKAFENVEHFEHHRSSSGGMVGRDVATAVGAADGIVVGGPVLRKVPIVHQSAMGGNIFGDSLRQLAYVEDVGAVGGNETQGVSEVIIDDHVTDSLDGPIGSEIDLSTRCGIAESFGVVGSTHRGAFDPPASNVGTHNESFLGPLNGGCHNFAPIFFPPGRLGFEVGLE